MSCYRLASTALTTAAVIVGLASSATAQRISIGGGAFGGGIAIGGGQGKFLDAAAVAKRSKNRVIAKPVVVDRPLRNSTIGKTANTRPPRDPKPPVVVKIPPVKLPPVVDRTPGNKYPPRDPKPPVIVKVPPIKVPPVVDRPPGNNYPPRDPKPPVIVRNPPAIPPAVVLLPTLPPVISPPGGSGFVPRPPSMPPLPPIASGPPPSLQSLDTFVPDEVLITVASTAPQTLEADVAQAFNVVILERTPLPLIDARLVRMRIPDSRTVPAVVAAIAADARVSLAQPNFLYRPSQDATARVQPAAVSGSGIQASLQYALAAMNFAGAQRLAPNQGRGARVAVIDSGIDRAHPDFASAKIDEFDAFAGEKKSAEDADRHGTGIAGIIAARGTVQGVAPAADVLSARVFRAKAGQASTATTQHILQGMTWSSERGARVLNMSFAGPRDNLVERHVNAVVARGVIPVAAAGNGGPDAAPAYPAAYDKVIAVTAIDAGGQLYAKANRGGYVAIAAPGVDVIVPGEGQSHEFQSGTSYAAAHVSGIVALMLEVNPELTPEAARNLLERATEDLGKPGRDDQFGYGKVDAERAVQLAMETRTR